jgi:hypothetical protein
VYLLDNLDVDGIIGVLEQEAGIYEDILKISQDKTNVIVEGKVAELESMFKLEQSLFLKIESLRICGSNWWIKFPGS